VKQGTVRVVFLTLLLVCLGNAVFLYFVHARKQKLNASALSLRSEDYLRRHAEELKLLYKDLDGVRAEAPATREILRLLDLKGGETIADIGCGGGFYTLAFSPLVGPSGTVFALDKKIVAVEVLKEQMERRGLKADNIRAQVSRVEEVGLPKESLDLAFLCEVHMFRKVYPQYNPWVFRSFYGSIGRALKPAGRLVVIEFVKHRALRTTLSREEMLREIEGGGFELVRFSRLPTAANTDPEYYFEFRKR